MTPTTTARVIIDDAPLREDEDYVPSDWVGREQQSRLLGACLEPIRSGRRPVHACLHGSAGTGKTAAALSALTRFRKETAVPFVVVNCYERDTLYKVLDHIITELRIFRAEEHRTSVKLERVQRHLGGRCLLVLTKSTRSRPAKGVEHCRTRSGITLRGG